MTLKQGYVKPVNNQLLPTSMSGAKQLMPSFSQQGQKTNKGEVSCY